ncbi:MAG: DUF58 domain-containing protein [Gammaproteobacteria bacterium]
MTSIKVASPVQVSVSELIELNRSVALLRKRPRRPKASQSGDYTSAIRGRGMEFDESRLYQPGDDIRNMDWRVTARTGEPHTKLFREERERPVFVWVDYRNPMFFATKGVFKAVFAARTAALIAWDAIQQGDRIGGLIFSEQGHHELKPESGKKGVLRLINRLVKDPVWNQSSKIKNTKNDQEPTSIKKAMMRLNRLVRPGSLVYLLSDFRDLENLDSEVSKLAKHCEVVLLPIHDPMEEQLPGNGTFRLSYNDQELTINTYDQSNLQNYQQHYQQHTEFLEQLVTRYRMRIISCLTTDDPLKMLGDL